MMHWRHSTGSWLMLAAQFVSMAGILVSGYSRRKAEWTPDEPSQLSIFNTAQRRQPLTALHKTGMLLMIAGPVTLILLFVAGVKF